MGSITVMGYRNKTTLKRRSVEVSPMDGCINFVRFCWTRGDMNVQTFHLTRDKCEVSWIKFASSGNQKYENGRLVYSTNYNARTYQDIHESHHVCTQHIPVRPVVCTVHTFAIMYVYYRAGTLKESGKIEIRKVYLGIQIADVHSAPDLFYLGRINTATKRWWRRYLPRKRWISHIRSKLCNSLVQFWMESCAWWATCNLWQTHTHRFAQEQQRLHTKLQVQWNPLIQTPD